MRLALLLGLLPIQAHAWTFTPGLICRLSHETPNAKIELTYDPAKPLYSVTVSRASPLPNVDPFTMRFIGPAGRVISTNRHTFNDDSTAVTAQDSGFGNVLDGLQFNDTAQAILGTTTITFPLNGAAEPTAEFRKCEVTAGA
ncbi:hypothetical protein [uncultured Litoreibacter sp.]|uniref:hypothetical protein n=1 Tax=uncultured Litoreibacter sp. TaxID=1392394 RepID=UPI0026365788|nr:hypothetical protein [uncultured Litoreibacter sp.]